MKRFTPLILAAALAACAPAVAPPPPVPIVFDAPYDVLFDATLQTMASTSVPGAGGRRLTFSIAEAERDTGLITAVREVEGRAAGAFSARASTRREVRSGLFFGLSFGLPPAPRRWSRAVITVVVRPDGDRASLAYSSTSSDTGSDSAVANRFMERVLERLNSRFAATQ